MLYPSTCPTQTSPRISNINNVPQNTPFPREIDNEVIARLLSHSSKEAYVSLLPYSDQDNPNPQLQAFNLTSYKRIILFGPVAISVLGQLDEIFLVPSKAKDDDIFMPPTNLQPADPEGDFLEGVMLLHPFTKAFTRVTRAAQTKGLANSTLLEIVKRSFPSGKIGRVNSTFYGLHSSSLLVTLLLLSLQIFSPSYLLVPKIPLSHFPSLKLKYRTQPLPINFLNKNLHIKRVNMALERAIIRKEGFSQSFRRGIGEVEGAYVGLISGAGRL